MALGEGGHGGLQELGDVQNSLVKVQEVQGERDKESRVREGMMRVPGVTLHTTRSMR